MTQGLGCTRQEGVSIRLPLGFPRKTTCLKGHEVIELLGAGRQLLVGGRCDTAQRAVGICGREETAQRRPQAPPRCHRDGHTGRTWERGDGSAAAPGSPTVSQGRAHGAGMGERRRLSSSPGHPGGVTGKGTQGRHGWGQRGRGRRRREAAGSAAPGALASCQLWLEGGPEWQEGPSSQSCCAVRRRRRTRSSAALSSSRRNEVPVSLSISSFIYLFILAALCGFGSSGPQSWSEPGPLAPRVRVLPAGPPGKSRMPYFPARVGSGDNVCPACQTRTAFISPFFILSSTTCFIL